MTACLVTMKGGLVVWAVGALLRGGVTCRVRRRAMFRAQGLQSSEVARTVKKRVSVSRFVRWQFVAFPLKCGCLTEFKLQPLAPLNPMVAPVGNFLQFRDRSPTLRPVPSSAKCGAATSRKRDRAACRWASSGRNRRLAATFATRPDCCGLGGPSGGQAEPCVARARDWCNCLATLICVGGCRPPDMKQVEGVGFAEV